MKIVFFFIATSALSTAAAIPMLSFGRASALAPLSPNHVPKVDFGYRPATMNTKVAAKDMIIDHYKGLEPGNEQKKARLAYVQNGWRDGTGPNDEHKQYLDFNYHRGEHQYSDKIGQTVTISRDRPLPEPHFAHSIAHESKVDMAKEMNKRYKALPPDQARRVRSMKVHEDWDDSPGLREQTQFTFHHGDFPAPHNTLGDPVTIYRPMSFLMDGVPKKEIPVIKKRVREEHEKLDENHPLKQANYGVVTQGWQKARLSVDLQVGPTLYKVKDQLSISAEEDFEKIGDFPVTLGMNKNSKLRSSSKPTRKT